MEAHGIKIDPVGSGESLTFDPDLKKPSVAKTLGLVEGNAGPETQRSYSDRGSMADHITLFFGKTLEKEKDLLQGKSVWEVGCGTAILSSFVHQLGAKNILATDVDQLNLLLAKRTAEKNKIPITVAFSNLFEGIQKGNQFDILMADLPQKPSPDGSLPMGQEGGPEGDHLLFPFLQQTPEWLRPGGSLFLFVHSLTHPRTLRFLTEHYQIRLPGTLIRIFHSNTYGNAFPYLLERRKENLSWFYDLPDGRHAFLGMIFHAIPK